MNKQVVDHLVTAPAAFKFKKLHSFCAWLVVVTVMFFFAAIVGTTREGYITGLWVISLFILPFWLIGVIGIAGLSDIVIDDNGIRRSFSGRVWQVIRWDNIMSIKTFDSFDRDARKMTRGFNIYPLTKPYFRFLPSGKMVFGERMERSSEFIALMNKYISTYDIKIESTVGGVKTFPNKL